MSGRTGTRLGDAMSYLFMLVMFVFFAGPLTYLLSMAMRDKREIYRGAARYIPNNPTIDNFITVLNNSYFPIYLWNGLKLAALSGLGVLIVALPAAYAFSFASAYGWCVFCIHCEEKIDLEASRCFGFCPRRPSPVPVKPWMA